MAAELEAKFRADGREPLDVLAGEARLGAAILDPGRTVDEVDRYLDTADGRLSARAWACRLRHRDGRTIVSLKGPNSPATPEAWLHRRPEVEAPATASPDPSDWPASEARRLLDELRGGQPLVERLRLRQERTERPVRGLGGLIGTLTLDVVQVEHHGSAAGSLFIVELEMADAEAADAARDLRELAAALGARPGLRPDGRTKLEHALGLLAAR